MEEHWSNGTQFKEGDRIRIKQTANKNKGDLGRVHRLYYPNKWYYMVFIDGEDEDVLVRRSVMELIK